MKRWFRKWFRYPAQDILLLISFCTAAFFVLFFSYSSEKLRKFEQERYPYNAVTEIFSRGYYGSGPTPEEWTQALEAIDKYVIFCNAASRKDGYSYCPGSLVYVLISQNEPFEFSFSDGGSFESCRNTPNAIILGKGWLPYLEERDSGYVFLYYDADLTVAAFLEDYSWIEGADDFRAFILWETLTPENAAIIRERILNSRVYAYSNKSSHEEMTEELKTSLAAVYENHNYNFLTEYMGTDLTAEDLASCKAEFTVRNPKETSDMGFSWYESYRKTAFPLGILFSMLICYHTAYIWLRRRRREYTIRLIYGFSRRKITATAFAGLLRFSAVAMGIALLAGLIFLPIYRESLAATLRLLACMLAGTMVLALGSLVGIWRNLSEVATQINEE
ncbi:MAG: hypothetical protein J5649_10145 [Lachnospiraceae bacterium]|nr:hypothetical protein [Lachnospiraceae bacterium]